MKTFLKSLATATTALMVLSQPTMALERYADWRVFQGGETLQLCLQDSYSLCLNFHDVSDNNACRVNQGPWLLIGEMSEMLQVDDTNNKLRGAIFDCDSGRPFRGGFDELPHAFVVCVDYNSDRNYEACSIADFYD